MNCEDDKVSVREHLQSQIDGLRKELIERSRMQENAVKATSRQMEQQFASVGEARQALERQAALMLPRQEFEVQHQRIVEQISELAVFVNDRMTREEAASAHQRIQDQLTALQDRLNRAEGKGIGLNAGWLYLLGGLSALGAIVSMVTLFVHIGG